MAEKMKTARQLERHIKGAANHWRIEILFLIQKNGGITLEDINARLDGNVKTVSEHVRKLSQAGLVNKKYRGREVEHHLSPYGERFYLFLKSF